MDLNDKIENLADFERTANHFSELQSIDLNALYDRNNIHLLEKPLSDDISGIFMKYEDEYMIIINTNKTKGHQNFTKAHEFYHFKYDKDLTTQICNAAKFDPTNESELSADLFATYFLMPENGIKTILSEVLKDTNGQIDISVLLHLGNIFKVSHAALVRRLRDLNLISPELAQHFYSIKIRATANRYGYQPDLYKSSQETRLFSDYKVLVEKLYNEEKITEKKYNELLENVNSLGIINTPYELEEENSDE
ncbi:hypothetical protein BBI11_00685 [Planococcus maritimus]|uniref:ImmA/IrrE family metallo-endopeptidase n=1 Tax=Planococcus maritimus TaxID=192421 RepID=UPI00080EF9AC|nr:ImmA/IrrE family metallo-endopeptidase [Planococcus maritimus]ANU15695.1 hypothetical protein BBI11_00685 [Planococcus maritimus]